MSDSLFKGLPPPSAPPPLPVEQKPPQSSNTKQSPQNQPPPPALKSALKRTKPPATSQPEATAPEKRLRFKTTTDASETQVIEAMKKIASHIKNLSKFSKASKLAIQLVEAGSVKPGTSDHFFAILEAAMSSPTNCNDPSVRADYHALFSAAQDVIDCFTKKQRAQLTTWTIKAVLANDLFTDDSFVFSKASGKIKDAISNLPVTTSDDDIEEAAVLTDETEVVEADTRTEPDIFSVPTSELNNKEESDPFGLDALIPSALKKDENMKGRKDAAVARIRKEEEDTKRILKSEREALILCLEIAARRYKIPWCQTVIDIIVNHAFDNVSRFNSKQRNAIEKLWASIREQQTRRKQGKSVSGKLDMNGFEWLQEKYANEKISIRHSVGSSTRRAEQWLG